LEERVGFLFGKNYDSVIITAPLVPISPYPQITGFSKLATSLLVNNLP
jgi:hypothetical protein